MKNRHYTILFIISVICSLNVLDISGRAQAHQEQPLVRIEARAYQRAVQGIADRLLYLYDNAPSIRVIIASHSEFTRPRSDRWKTVAMFVSNYEGKEAILLNPEHVGDDNFRDVVDSIMHELIHYWIYWKGADDSDTKHGHGRAFLNKAIEIKVNITDVINHYQDSHVIYKQLMAERRGRTPGGQATGSVGGNHPPLHPDGNHFGSGIYEFNFSPYGAGKTETVLSDKLKGPPKIGDQYKWRGKLWQVNNVVGTNVFLKEVLKITSIVNRTRYDISFDFWDNYGVRRSRILQAGETWYSSKPNADIVVEFDTRLNGKGQRKAVTLEYNTTIYRPATEKDKKEAPRHYFTMDSKGSIDLKCCENQ